MQRKCCARHTLGLMGICCRPPGGDGQKRPSRDLGKSGCLSQLGEDWVTDGEETQRPTTPGPLTFCSHRLQWQLLGWGSGPHWQKAIQNPGYPAATCKHSGERPAIWQSGRLSSPLPRGMACAGEGPQAEESPQLRPYPHHHRRKSGKAEQRPLLRIKLLLRARHSPQRRPCLHARPPAQKGSLLRMRLLL